MMRRLLFCYQICVAISDSCTGLLLLGAPLFTLRAMHLSAPPGAVVYLSWIGVFVASVGFSCAYGVKLMACRGCSNRLETIWILTALTRAMVAAFLCMNIASRNLEPGWCTLALFDGTCACLQVFAVRRGWIKNEFGI